MQVNMMQCYDLIFLLMNINYSVSDVKRNEKAKYVQCCSSYWHKIGHKRKENVNEKIGIMFCITIIIFLV